jgi:hypothetical protein
MRAMMPQGPQSPSLSSQINLMSLAQVSSRPKKSKSRLLRQVKKFRSKLVQITALQRHYTENSNQIFPEKELRGHSPSSYIRVYVSDLHILTIGSAYSAAGK